MITRFPSPTIDSNGHLDVVQHAHPDTVLVHADIAVTGGTDIDLILIDLSDTSGFKHSNTGYVHIETIGINIDADTNAAWICRLGFLENVDATDGDFYEVTHIEGTKSTGQNIDFIRTLNPSGARMSSSYVTTSDIDANDVTFQTDVNLPSAIDPTTSDTPSGSGDVVLRIDAGAGGANTNFTVNIAVAYHTHA